MDTNLLRDALSENTLIEVKNGKIYITLEFTDSQYSLIDNIRIAVDGKQLILKNQVIESIQLN